MATVAEGGEQCLTAGEAHACERNLRTIEPNNMTTVAEGGEQCLTAGGAHACERNLRTIEPNTWRPSPKAANSA